MHRWVELLLDDLLFGGNRGSSGLLSLGSSLRTRDGASGVAYSSMARSKRKIVCHLDSGSLGDLLSLDALLVGAAKSIEGVRLA